MRLLAVNVCADHSHDAGGEECLICRVRELEAALRQYEDARHWGIMRDGYRHPSAVWLGPGAEETPVPNPMGVAREALRRNPTERDS
jgi:hypothetical protein